MAARPELCHASPHQIVPRLADRGEYLASASSCYRVLKLAHLLTHRGRATPAHRARPRAYEVTAPRTLFSWDITYVWSPIRGQYFYLYLFVDVFSRTIVGAEVHAEESMAHSSRLLERMCRAESIEPYQVSVHADNGGAMKGATMLATMQRLGVMPSFSRPSVSNDNPCSESLFRTLKYCPVYPTDPLRAWTPPAHGSPPFFSGTTTSMCTVAFGSRPRPHAMRARTSRSYTTEIVSITPPNAPIPRGGQAPHAIGRRSPASR